jgi:site-specific DNA-methyltransferase (adenine-specific)
MEDRISEISKFDHIKPDFSIENQYVYYKSSEQMTELADSSIDVIVTSPPYNRGKNYSSLLNDESPSESYNDNLSKEDYLEFLIRLWKECYRVASNKCVFFLNIGDSARDQGLSEDVARSAEKAGWKRIQDIIWVKSIYGKGHYTPTGGSTSSGNKKRLNNIWEHIYLYVKDLNEYELDTKSIGIPYADKTNIGRYSDSDLRDPGNVFHICYEKTTGATVKKGHDAPFPIGLPYSCIKMVVGAKSVLDPFLGTGTTLAAAYSLKIKGIGYEKYPRAELIKETILSGIDYKPKPVILIPHYESAIMSLLKLFDENKFTLISPTTKKQYMEWSILLDTLGKMDIKTKITDCLRDILVKSEFSENGIINHQTKNSNTKKFKDEGIDRFLD